MRIEDNSSRVMLGVGVVMGAIAGIALALLLAPKSGRESRETVTRQVRQYVGTLRRRLGRSRTNNDATEETAAEQEVSS